MDFMKLFKRSKSIIQKEKSEEDLNETSEQSDDFADASDLNLNTKIQSNATRKKSFLSSQKGWRRSFHRPRRKNTANFTSNSYEDILQNHEVVFTNNPTGSTSHAKGGTNRWSYSPGVTPECETNSFPSPRQPSTNTDYRDNKKAFDFENGNLVENTCDDLVEGTDHQQNGNNSFRPSSNHPVSPHKPISSHAGSVRKLEYVTETEQQESHKAHSLSHLIPKTVSVQPSYQSTSVPNVNYPASNASAEVSSSLERKENSEVMGAGKIINSEALPNNDFSESPRAEDSQSAYYNNNNSVSCYNPTQRTWSKASSRYERETDDVLDNLEGRGDGYEQHTHTSACQHFERVDDTYEQAEDLNSEDNISWGSQEFETDSDESGVYENDHPINQNKLPPKSDGSKSAENNNLFWKRREIGKDISKGVLKLLERKDRRSISKKNSREDEPSSFVDTCISSKKYRGPHLQAPPLCLSPNQLRRRRILETIITSESSYIDSLERLEIDYKKALLDCKPPIVNSDIVEKIFYKISDILQCHQLFQFALAESVRSWDEREMIGHTFVASFSKSMVVECYSGYINNFTNATDLVHKTCLRKPQFLSFLQERQYESLNQLDVYGLMLKPVQRFPQFIMLVQDLLKHTPKDHSDRLQLQFALTELEALTDNLNLRRENEEQKAEMVRLLESSNIKLVPQNATLQGSPRKVLKQGMLRERTYNDEGTLEKERECLIVLTNDLLICCSAANKRHASKLSNLTLRDLYKMKWSAPLDVLTIKSSLDQSNERDSEAMKKDYEILEKIKHLVDNLYFPYDKLSSHQVESHMQTLETKITLAQAQSQHSKENYINIAFPQKSGEIRRMLLSEHSSHFHEWLESINNAKLANEPNNLHCWYSADGSENGYLWKAPLFLEYFDIQPNNMQIQCAHAFMPVSKITSLWLACSASTVLAVVNIYQSVGGKMEKVHVMQVESSVQCMEHWNPSGDCDSVWLGMECGSLIEFSTDVTYSKMCEITLPTMSTVMIMKGIGSNLYVGLLDCTLIMYNRSKGMTGLNLVKTIAVGSGHLTCLSHINGRLCGSSGNDLVYINRETLEVESISTIPTDESMIVSNVVVVGTGLWVAFSGNCNLHLYHLETLNLLQDLNLNRPIRDYFQNLGMSKLANYPCHVTSLWSSYWKLVVGTSNGLILIFSLPKLSNSVPKITGPCRICYHTMTGPVRFICAPEIPNKVDSEMYDTKLKMPKLNSPIAELGNLESIIESETRDSNTFHKRRRSESSIMLPNRFLNSAISNRTNFKEMSLEKRKSTSAVPGQVILPRDVFLTKEEDSEAIQQYESKKKSWKKEHVKSHPLLLACGEGYNYLGKHEDSLKGESGTTVLCWKIT